jgi:hypothetical protein
MLWKTYCTVLTWKSSRESFKSRSRGCKIHSADAHVYVCICMYAYASRVIHQWACLYAVGALNPQRTCPYLWRLWPHAAFWFAKAKNLLWLTRPGVCGYVCIYVCAYVYRHVCIYTLTYTHCNMHTYASTSAVQALKGDFANGALNSDIGWCIRVSSFEDEMDVDQRLCFDCDQTLSWLLSFDRLMQDTWPAYTRTWRANMQSNRVLTVAGALIFGRRYVENIALIVLVLRLRKCVTCEVLLSISSNYAPKRLVALYCVLCTCPLWAKRCWAFKNTGNFEYVEIEAEIKSTLTSQYRLVRNMTWAHARIATFLFATWWRRHLQGCTRQTWHARGVGIRHTAALEIQRCYMRLHLG